MELCSQPGLLSVVVPDKPPSTQVLLECQKCLTCVGGFRPSSRLRATTCKCGHVKKWHVAVKTDSQQSLVPATNVCLQETIVETSTHTLTSADIDVRKSFH